jgi:hypothetical protein
LPIQIQLLDIENPKYPTNLKIYSPYWTGGLSLHLFHWCDWPLQHFHQKDRNSFMIPLRDLK